MRIKNFLACSLILILSAFSAFSQDKAAEEQLGGGVEIGTSNWIGIHGTYALNPDMHFGAHLGFVFDGGTSTSSSTSNLLFAPFFRYFLPKIAKSLKPYGEAMLAINTGTESVANLNDPNNPGTESFASTAIKISIGAYWFPYSSVGVYGGFRFFNLGLDPTRIQVGLGQAFMGIEWFLDK